MIITQQFLKAKHWQLFLLLFGIPVVCQIFLMTTVFRGIMNQERPDPAFVLNYFKFFPLIMILVGGVFFGWLWSIGTGLQDKIPVGVTMKVKKFKIFFFIPVVYIAIISLIVGKLISASLGAFQEMNPDFALMAAAMVVILPLHFFSMFCILYCFYFVAKTLKTVELQRAVTFSDFAGEFVLIWFYFIGVWIIQPKVNKMVEDNTGQSA